MVKRLSQELAARLAAEGPAAAHSTLLAARTAAAAGAADDAGVPLPPWINDSRCVGPKSSSHRGAVRAGPAAVAQRMYCLEVHWM